MDKPISLSVKDYIIRKMAVKMMMSEETLNAIVSHQFQSANEAMSKNKSIELSGFGKFHFNYGKAVKKMEKMLVQREHLMKHLSNPDMSETRKNTARLKIESLTAAIEILKPMIDETVRDLRGLEEQVGSTFPPERTNS